MTSKELKSALKKANAELEQHRKQEIEEKDSTISALRAENEILRQDFANAKQLAEQRYDACVELKQIYEDTVRELREKVSGEERLENARRIVRSTPTTRPSNN